MNQPTVAIIVLNWNGIDDTVDCIDSLIGQSYENAKIIIVDNGSDDGSLEVLRKMQKKWHSKIVLIENGKNSGFAGGVNIGILYAINHQFDYVALFNNDAIAEEQWLYHLIKAIEKPDASIATGLLLRSDGKTIDGTGDFYSYWGMPFPRDRNQLTAKKADSGYVFGATGGASLYRTSLFTEIGLFDVHFFAYYEDIDISFRAQLAGHKIYYTSQAVAYHQQGASSNKMRGFTVYQTFKNIPILFVKNVPLRLLFPVGARLLLVYFLMFANAVKNGKGWYALKGWLMSIWIFFTSSLWQRFVIQKHKTVTSRYIKSAMWPSLPPDQTGVRAFLAKFKR